MLFYKYNFMIYTIQAIEKLNSTVDLVSDRIDLMQTGYIYNTKARRNIDCRLETTFIVI